MDFNAIEKRKVRAIRKSEYLELLKMYPEFKGHLAKHVWLEFPESYDFISPMESSNKERLLRLDWNVPQTNFIEIPYLMSFVPTFLLPAPCAFLLPSDFEHRVYYRTLVYTKGWVAESTNLSLKDDIEHEKIERESCESRLRTGKSAPPRESVLTNEKLVKVKTARILMERYKIPIEKVMEELLDYATKSLDWQRRTVYPTILSDILIYWFDFYFTDNFEKFKFNAIPMTVETLKWVPTHRKKCEFIEKMYFQLFGMSLSRNPSSFS